MTKKIIVLIAIVFSGFVIGGVAAAIDTKTKDDPVDVVIRKAEVVSYTEVREISETYRVEEGDSIVLTIGGSVVSEYPVATGTYVIATVRHGYAVYDKVQKKEIK